MTEQYEINGEDVVKCPNCKRHFHTDLSNPLSHECPLCGKKSERDHLLSYVFPLVPGRYYVMPRNPRAVGLNFQASVYQLTRSGMHNLICEVYIAGEAERICDALNSAFPVQ